MATSVKFAVVDVNDFLTKKQTNEPSLAADWAKLEELYNKKLWHQVTLKLQEFVKHPFLQTGDNLIQLYNNFLSTFENKINPLSLVEIVAVIVEQYKDKKEAIAFLEKIEQKVKINDEATALCKVLQGQIYLEQLNDLDSTERVIGELEGSLEDADGVTPVHGRFYKLASEYYRVRGPMSKYYRAALRYVGCARGGAALPQAERQALALRLALAAVLAHDVYDLAELWRRYVGCARGGAALPQAERQALALRLALAAVLAHDVYDLAELWCRYVGCARGGAALPQAERQALALRLALAAVLAHDVYDLAELWCRYVGCARGGAALPQAERQALALRLALAAVLAHDVYDLAELASASGVATWGARGGAALPQAERQALALRLALAAVLAHDVYDLAELVSR
ncbi:unnamed protein product [Plutella xylostella]|uniref:(diamondback moth) hypothetical protein n=1 Tax=Plutella xylostella TaxID=51655 RepID=A0A8S4G5I4_PLUXY|nr:unnamed protein product [Plutella xylostella]